MRHSYPVIVSVLVAFAILPSVSLAWTTYYDGTQLPTEQGWTFGGNDISQCTTDGSSLRILDNSSQAGAWFWKPVTPYGQQVTMEAKVRVANASGLWSVFLKSTNGTVATWLSFFPDELRVTFGGGTYPWFSFPADFSDFRTVRLAIDSQNRSYVWLDGDLLIQDIAQSGQGSSEFGSPGYSGMSDSYWDYVAASPEFLPIPEPSSLLALGGGLGGIAGLLRRRR